MPARDDTFLGRWSRRKQDVAREALKPAPQPEASEEDAARDDLPDDGLSDAEILAKLGLPDPDDLNMGDDFKRYLAVAVPQRIRQRALRNLWLSNPVLANLDGLNDYEQDFTDAATMAKGVATSYEVGRGFGKRLVDLVEDVPEEAHQADLGAALSEEADDPPVAYHPTPQDEDADEPPPQSRAPRRMVFSFEGAGDRDKSE